jgi:hypothetical protein
MAHILLMVARTPMAILLKEFAMKSIIGEMPAN